MMLPGFPHCEEIPEDFLLEDVAHQMGPCKRRLGDARVDLGCKDSQHHGVHLA